MYPRRSPFFTFWLKETKGSGLNEYTFKFANKTCTTNAMQNTVTSFPYSMSHKIVMCLLIKHMAHGSVCLSLIAKYESMQDELQTQQHWPSRGGILPSIHNPRFPLTQNAAHSHILMFIINRHQPLQLGQRSRATYAARRVCPALIFCP